MIKLAVFDLDGTLIDSLPSIAHALDSALAAINYPLVGEDNTRQWIGNGSDVLVARGMSRSRQINADLPPELLANARQIFNQTYQAAGHQFDRIYPNVAPTLDKLAAKGIKMAVLTNKTECFVEPILQHFAIDQHFKYVIAGNTLSERKPSPLGLHWLANKFQVTAQEMLMVGDSENDIKAAQAAGCLSIGLTYGYNYGVPISEADPDFVIDDFAQLLDIPALKHTQHALLEETV
ncbi:phosphoglycolate phosphatase [Saccharobesus litoralis]|uniref:Phosphoglycolate phosphatase n=1 Tax=Saccharobesus litoralis TaxID=2172099 RepID=A0A2S0VS31_9ALTE|nr:phosphoglycolate phosphatase [Saccharobesus litoralis]AWB66910.1 phosphoglycolate phosphatase [Saccharobesus litoralis]